MCTQLSTIDFLAASSEASLESFELTRLNGIANVRKGILSAVSNWAELEVEAQLARWILERKGRRLSPRRNTMKRLSRLIEVEDASPRRFIESTMLHSRSAAITLAANPSNDNFAFGGPTTRSLVVTPENCCELNPGSQLGLFPSFWFKKAINGNAVSDLVNTRSPLGSRRARWETSPISSKSRRHSNLAFIAGALSARINQPLPLRCPQCQSACSSVQVQMSARCSTLNFDCLSISAMTRRYEGGSAKPLANRHFASGRPRGFGARRVFSPPSFANTHGFCTFLCVVPVNWSNRTIVKPLVPARIERPLFLLSNLRVEFIYTEFRRSAARVDRFMGGMTDRGHKPDSPFKLCFTQHKNHAGGHATSCSADRAIRSVITTSLSLGWIPVCFPNKPPSSEYVHAHNINC
jgi:hypothetical protein